MSELEVAFYLDLLVLISCTALLLRYGRLSHSHPAAIYLFFHVYTFTLRLLGVQLGALTLFATWGSRFQAVTYSELARAALLADIAFVAITVACIKASRYSLKKDAKEALARSEQLSEGSESAGARTLSLRHIWRVVVIFFPIGIVGLIFLTYLPGTDPTTTDLGEWQSSSWIGITQTWAGLVLIGLIYWYGFRWALMVPMASYLMIMSFQGYHRFRVIIPVILLVQIYLDRKNLKWPSLRIATLLIAAILLFYPLKSIGVMVQHGASFDDILNVSTQITGQALGGGSDDQQFMDQFASALTLADENGKLYYGGTYVPLISVAIPRQWWPDKPGLADYLRDISRPWRPMAETGMITTILGESYVNFGGVGILLVPFLFAYWLSRAYFRAYRNRNSYFTIARFAYLLIACNLIQVYRDGIQSIIIYTWVNMMPLMVVVTLHFFFPLKAQADSVPKLVGMGVQQLPH